MATSQELLQQYQDLQNEKLNKRREAARTYKADPAALNDALRSIDAEYDPLIAKAHSAYTQALLEQGKKR